MNAIAHYKWTLRTAAAYEKAAKEKAERREAERREAERLEVAKAAEAAEAAEIDAAEIDADPEVAALLASDRAHAAQTFYPCSGEGSGRRHCECCKSRVAVHLRDAIDEARDRAYERIRAARSVRARVRAL